MNFEIITPDYCTSCELNMSPLNNKKYIQDNHPEEINYMKTHEINIFNIIFNLLNNIKN